MSPAACSVVGIRRRVPLALPVHGKTRVGRNTSTGRASGTQALCHPWSVFENFFNGNALMLLAKVLLPNGESRVAILEDGQVRPLDLSQVENLLGWHKRFLRFIRPV